MTCAVASCRGVADRLWTSWARTSDRTSAGGAAYARTAATSDHDRTSAAHSSHSSRCASSRVRSGSSTAPKAYAAVSSRHSSTTSLYGARTRKDGTAGLSGRIGHVVFGRYYEQNLSPFVGPELAMIGAAVGMQEVARSHASPV